MKLVELYEFISKKMREDGKSSAWFETIVNDSSMPIVNKAKMIADIINPKYLPADFVSNPTLSDEGMYILLCYDYENGGIIFMRTYNTLWDAQGEMGRQYRKVYEEDGEGRIHSTTADYYHDTNQRYYNLEWKIFNTDSRIYNPVCDDYFN